MPEGRRPRGVTPRQRSGVAPRVPGCDGAGTAEKSYPSQRSGAAAERSYPASKVRGGGQEALPHAPTPEARGHGREEQPHARGQGQQPRGATPRLRSGVTAGRSYPTTEARGGGWEEQPHAKGQGRQPGGPTPCPRSSGCAGAGGPRGAIPCSRSGRAVVRRYHLSKVRSSGCALLEQP